MVKTPLRLLKAAAEQFTLIRPPDQSTRPMETIMRETLDEDGIPETQLPPVGLYLRDQ